MTGEHSPRVLLASRLFPPEVNAASFRLGALVRGLTARSSRVTVVTAKPARHAPPAADAAGVDISRWPVLRDRGGNVRGYIQYMSFDVPLAFRILFRRFDVIVAEAPPTTGLVSSVVARLRRRPFAYYAADVWTDGVAAVGAPGIVVRVMRWMESSVLRSAAVILSVSEGVNDRLERLGADPSRIVVVGHGVDTDVFRPDGERSPSEPPCFVYTGTMSEVHQPQVFVHALAEIAQEEPEVRLAFFGQGVYRDELERLAQELVPGRVSFGGVIPPEQTAQQLRGAVASLVSMTPGIGYDFAHPTKAYAAAACGTPILFAGPDSFGDIIRDAALGEAVQYDVEAVVEAMRRSLAAHRSGESESARPRRAEWARANVSLDTVGDRAAGAVLAVLSGVPAEHD